MLVIAESALTAWHDYYVIVGGGAAALTGLMFVAITVIFGAQRQRSERATKAFATPTIVHFSAALGIAAILSAPWPSLWMVSAILGVTGIGGTLYIALAMWRMQAEKQTYQPVIEDWVFYGILPLLAYVVLAVAGVLMVGHLMPMLFVVAAVPLLLLFIGIHNAWDITTYIAVTLPQREAEASDAAPTQPTHM